MNNTEKYKQKGIDQIICISVNDPFVMNAWGNENKVGDKIVGDVQFDAVKDKVKGITPVPGGVGPMTIACLLKNTLECFKGR